VSIDEAVDFDDVVDRLLGMLTDVTGSESRIKIRREGSFGEMTAEPATALVLVLTELVQNAVEHAFPDDAAGTVTVLASRDRAALTVTVRDDGVGLPGEFSSANVDRLGLQIVQTLVSAELAGAVDFRPQEGGGTAVTVSVPLARASRERR
jgi:two-component sensor histidine kinase